MNAVRRHKMFISLSKLSSYLAITPILFRSYQIKIASSIEISNLFQYLFSLWLSSFVLHLSVLKSLLKYLQGTWICFCITFYFFSIPFFEEKRREETLSLDTSFLFTFSMLFKIFFYSCGCRCFFLFLVEFLWLTTGSLACILSVSLCAPTLSLIILMLSDNQICFVCVFFLVSNLHCYFRSACLPFCLYLWHYEATVASHRIFWLLTFIKY